MNIIIDLILVAIIIVSAYLAAKKGFIGTLFSLLGSLIAIALSIVLCSPVSVFINENYVNPAVKQYIITAVDSSSVGKSYEEAISGIDVASKIESMPESLKKVLELADIETNEIISSASAITENSVQAKDSLISNIASPISATISSVIALVGLFIVLSIALWVVSKLLTALFNLIPVGKSLNKFGGVLFGVIRGIVIVFVISTLFTAVSRSVDPESNNIFSQKTIENTVVLKNVSSFNPVEYIMKLK